MQNCNTYNGLNEQIFTEVYKVINECANKVNGSKKVSIGILTNLCKRVDLELCTVVDISVVKSVCKVPVFANKIIAVKTTKNIKLKERLSISNIEEINILRKHSVYSRTRNEPIINSNKEEATNIKINKRSLELNEQTYKYSGNYFTCYNKPPSTNLNKGKLYLQRSHTGPRRKSISYNKRGGEIKDVIHTKQIAINRNTSNRILSKTLTEIDNPNHNSIFKKLKELSLKKPPKMVVAKSCKNLYTKKGTLIKMHKRHEAPINVSSLLLSTMKDFHISNI